MTVSDLIKALQLHDPSAVVLVAHHHGYVPADVCKLASTEYGLEPRGVAKVAIVPAR